MATFRLQSSFWKPRTFSGLPHKNGSGGQDLGLVYLENENLFSLKEKMKRCWSWLGTAEPRTPSFLVCSTRSLSTISGKQCFLRVTVYMTVWARWKQWTLQSLLLSLSCWTLRWITQRCAFRRVWWSSISTSTLCAYVVMQQMPSGRCGRGGMKDGWKRHCAKEMCALPGVNIPYMCAVTAALSVNAVCAVSAAFLWRLNLLRSTPRPTSIPVRAASSSACAASFVSLPFSVGSTYFPMHDEREQTRNWQKFFEDVIPDKFLPYLKCYKEPLTETPQILSCTPSCQLPLSSCNDEPEETYSPRQPDLGAAFICDNYHAN